MSDTSDAANAPAADGPDPARSFGGVADSYDRGRPAYPGDAVRWLTGEQPLTILELGAGTGKLTRALVELGHDVHATDPDPAMLERLARNVPGTRISQTTAEEIPAADATFDLVVAGQAYHWFDKERALPEIARVLKRGGSLALVWNVRDERIPWVKRLGRLIGNQDVTASGPDQALEESPYFGPVEDAAFKHWQTVDRVSIQDLVRSRSNVAVLTPEAREAKLAEVLDFYDDFGRGMDGMQLPYLAQCYRAVVGIRPRTEPRPAASATSGATERAEGPLTEDGLEPTVPVAVSRRGYALYADEADGAGRTDGDGPDATAERPGAGRSGGGSMADPPTDDDSGMLLIDFR